MAELTKPDYYNGTEEQFQAALQGIDRWIVEKDPETNKVEVEAARIMLYEQLPGVITKFTMSNSITEPENRMLTHYLSHFGAIQYGAYSIIVEENEDGSGGVIKATSNGIPVNIMPCFVFGKEAKARIFILTN